MKAVELSPMYLEDVVLRKLLLTRALRYARKQVQGRAYSYWQRDSLSQRPLAGFDCSALILCAAQIVGMPYYC